MALPRPAGWWYPWIFVAGMLVVIAVNGVMIAYAIGTFPGLETEDAYRKGLAYNQTIAADNAQAARGWQAVVRFRPDGGTPAAPPTAPDTTSRSGELEVAFTDASGNPVSGLTVSALLLRPTHRGEDVAIALDVRGGGRYAAFLRLPRPGQWDAWVRASGAAGDFQTTRRIFVP